MLIEKSAPETSCSSRLDGIAKPSWLNARFNLLRPCACPKAIFSAQYKVSTLFGVGDVFKVKGNLQKQQTRVTFNRIDAEGMCRSRCVLPPDLTGSSHASRR